MLKNIGKSIFWFMLYIVASIVGMLTACIGYFVINPSAIESLDNLDMETLVNDIAVPYLIIAAIICIATFCIYKLIRKHPFDIKTINWKRAVFCSGTGIFLNGAISFCLAILILVLPSNLVEHYTTSVSIVGGNFWITIIGVGILVPIMEEIIFRYGIFGILSRSNKVAGYIVSALMFGIVHGNIIQGVYAAVLGLVLAFLYDKGKNLWYPIVVHMSINSLSTIASQFPDVSGLIVIGTGLVGLVVMIVMILKVKDVKTMFAKEAKVAVEENKCDGMEK